jgi:N-methylhydantoinase B
VPLRVELVVSHAPEPTITVDFSASAASVAGPMNGAPATAACAAFTAIKSFLDPLSPINGGAFRPIRIVTKPRTIYEAQPPSAMCGSLDLGYRTLEAVMGALGAILPESAVGDHSSPSHLYLPVWDAKRSRHYVFYECPVGGTGAVSGHDGSSALAGFERGDFPRISSVEIWEHQVPFFAVENALIADSGGAGEFRGGLGMRRSWQLLEDTSSVSDLSEPCLVPGYGVLGGYGGAPSTLRVIRGKEVLWPGGVTGTGKATRFPLRRGDIVRVDKWGGGGYGDPLLREPERVLRDLKDGLISEDAAHDLYGLVVLDGCVSIAATEQRRRQLAAQRVFVAVTVAKEDVVEANARLHLIGPALAARLHVKNGDILECLRDRRPPLRGMARIDSRAGSEQIPLGPIGRKVLGVASGDRVWIRTVPGALYPPLQPAVDAPPTRDGIRSEARIDHQSQSGHLRARQEHVGSR